MKILDYIFPPKLSVSVSVFVLSSAFIRFIGLGCIGLAFYIKYGDPYDIIGDAVIPALNSIEMYGMPFGSYIQSLLFGTAVVFGAELITGVFGVLAGKNKSDTVLILYMGFCVISILVYSVLITLWSILYYFINNGLGSWMVEYKSRYQSNNLLNGYREKWRDLYSYVGCCGSTGKESGCSTGDIGCQDIYQARFSLLYASAYISIFIVCIFCQICSLLAAHYTIKKNEIKANNNRRISKVDFYLLWSSDFGIFRQFRTLLEDTKERSPMKLTSLVIKSLAVISGSGMMITSFRLLASGLLHKSELVTFFRQVHAYNYNMHNALTGFCCCVLAIGFLTIINAVIGIVGSMKKSTALHTFTFFGSALFAIFKVIAAVVWVVILEKFNRAVVNDIVTLAEKTDTDSIMLTNRVMLFFKCCRIGSTTVQQFCYGNVHESVTTLTKSYYRDSTSVNSGVSGDQDNFAWCAAEISKTIKIYSAIYFSFLAASFLLDILTMIYTSKEFKENQTIHNKDNTVQTSLHLIQYHMSLYREKPKWFLVRLIYIIMTVFMLMVELSFIVLVAIFGVSYHVSRDYIDDIGDLFKFLALSGVVLVPLIIINRFMGIAAIFYKRYILLYVSTGLTVLSLILSFTYMIMASVLRHHEYPCTYVDFYTKHTISCSLELRATTGVALAVAVLEIIAEMLTLVLNDRGHKYFSEESSSEPSSNPGIIFTLYNFLFVNRHMFTVNPKLGRWACAYFIFSGIMMLLEITFIVLDCFYGFTWLRDRTWITTGLHDIQRGTINVGVLFNFLKISFLVLLPIICANRFVGGIAIMKNRKVILYVNTIVTAFTTVYTLVCLCLTIIVFESLAGCNITEIYYWPWLNYNCPTRKYTIVGSSIALLGLEFLIQIASLVINDRCYKYFKLAKDEENENLIAEKDSKGLFATVYDKIFRRREAFKGAGKLEIAIGIHVTTACFLLMIEITFFVLVIVYGLSSALNRDWIEIGLDNLFVTSMNMRVLYQFLAICSAVLVPLIVINRFVAIIAVSKKRKTVLYISSGILGITLVITIVCLFLGSILMYQEPNCGYALNNNTVQKGCPRMKGSVGIGVAVLIIEFLMQVYSTVVNDRSHAYFNIQSDEESVGDKGMFATFYDAVFRRRKVFESTVAETMVAIHVIASIFLLMLEVTFIVLDAVYGISYVISRRWIDAGLGDLTIISMDLYTLYKFLSIGILSLVVVIAANRSLGHIAISTSRKMLLYVNTTMTIVTTLITVVFVILNIILLSAKDRCSYDDHTDCPFMDAIVGSGLAMLSIELTVQIFTLIVNDRASQYMVQIESEETSQEKREGLFKKVYNAIFRRRRKIERSKRFDVLAALYAVTSVLFLLMEISFIVLIAIYGLSNVLNRDWINVGLDIVYFGAMDMETVFKLLAIGSLALVPFNIAGRCLGFGILSFEKSRWTKISFGINVLLLVINGGFVFLGSVLMYKEKDCGFTETVGYNSCFRMKGIVGVGLGMLIAEFLMQIACVRLSYIQLKDGSNKIQSSDAPLRERRKSRVVTLLDEEDKESPL